MPVVQTIMHDKMHLWFHQSENRYKVIKFLADKKGFEFSKEFATIVDVEKPVFVKESRRFIIDLIVDLVSEQHCAAKDNINNNGLMTAKSLSGRELKITRGAIYRRVIADFKPNFTHSVSNALGQIRTYQHYLSYNKWQLGMKKTSSFPDMMIITLDQMATMILFARNKQSMFITYHQIR